MKEKKYERGGGPIEFQKKFHKRWKTGREDYAKVLGEGRIHSVNLSRAQSMQHRGIRGKKASALGGERFS